MNKEEKNLIDEIRNEFYNYEIPYEEGAWEEFRQTSARKEEEVKVLPIKKRKGLWKPFAAAAAFIGFTFFVALQFDFVNPDGNHLENPVEAIAVVEAPSLEEIPSSVVSQSPEKDIFLSASGEHFHPADADHLADVLQFANDAHLTSGAHLTQLNTLQTQHKAMENSLLGGVEPNTADKLLVTDLPSLAGTEFNGKLDKFLDENTKQTFPSVENQLVVEPYDRLADQKKWKIGVEVNSLFIDEKPGVSAGFVTQFELSDKVKLSAGLSYGQFTASHQEAPIQVAEHVRKIGGTSTLKTLDIPLAVIVEPIDGWYASVGVSAISVMNERNTMLMEVESLKERVFTDHESGATVSVFDVVKSTYNQHSSQADFEGRKDLGYLNFSIGRRKRMTDRLDLHVEPFVKVPIGGLQRQDMNLLNSGIKLKVLF
jgi:hypothetical protein